jgi:hypothetical protein
MVAVAHEDSFVAAFVIALISLHDDSMRAMQDDSCNIARISLLDDDSVVALTRDSFATACDAAVAPASLDCVSRDSLVTVSNLAR